MTKIQLKNIPAITLATAGVIVGASLLTVGTVVAATKDEQYPPIVQNLAERFNLDPKEVQDVFEETRQEQRSERFDRAVEEGKLTEEQRNLLEEKHMEMEAAREEIWNSDMTDEEKMEAMHELMEEHHEWMDESGIEKPERDGFGGSRSGFGGHRGGMMGGRR